MLRHHFARSGIGQKRWPTNFRNSRAFPAAQPVPCDMNEIVRNALDVFAGRLDGIDLRVDLGSGSSAGQCRSRAVQARGRQPGRQRRRSHARVADEAPAGRPPTPSPANRWSCWWPTPAAEFPPPTRKNCSCPYFSTKGRGTGLGSGHRESYSFRARRAASASRTIVPPARGFTSRFPLCRRSRRRRLRGSRVKNTRVLIVDDEPGIRESLLGVLEDEGYNCAARRNRRTNAWKNSLARTTKRCCWTSGCPAWTEWKRWRAFRRSRSQTARRW